MARWLAFAFVAWPLACAAQALPESLILAAKPEFLDPTYGQTVLIVRSIGNDQHVGFIVNRPSTITLGRILPERKGSSRVKSLVYMGGPFAVQGLFVLLERPDSPGAGSVRMMPGVYAVFDGKVVDRIIAANPSNARYLVGMVAWQPGELRAEIGRGAWYVLAADAGVAFRDPEGLWEELTQNEQR